MPTECRGRLVRTERIGTLTVVESDLIFAYTAIEIYFKMNGNRNVDGIRNPKRNAAED